MATVEIDTGDIESWASSMEKRGDEYARELVKAAKGKLEDDRKKGKLRFAKIKRKQTGHKRFALQKGQGPKAELIKGHKGSFHDIFKG
jgi:hypothetical protein